MKRQVRWSEDALSDFDEQTEYIAYDNPEAALRMAARLREAAGRLGTSPLGRPGHEFGTYEKVALGAPYIIVYELPEEAPVVNILRVYHGAQNWWGDN